MYIRIPDKNTSFVCEIALCVDL
uniref:Uncharacterized protein n=1 Tax=Arundo donax TaxID=35708 RepID=A0A0A9B9Y3_ARUDO